MMERREQDEGLSILERAGAWLGATAGSISDVPSLELIGQRELRMENYRSILACGKEEIHVDGGKWVLRIVGKDLEIRAMRERDLLITGRIARLELL